MNTCSLRKPYPEIVVTPQQRQEAATGRGVPCDSEAVAQERTFGVTRKWTEKHETILGDAPVRAQTRLLAALRKPAKVKRDRSLCRSPKSLAVLLIFPVFAASSGLARAGGLYVHEFGTPSMGTASAGAQAVATDASTAGHNPAGMTRIDGNQFMLAGGLLYSDVHFDRDPATPVLGSSGGDAGGFAPILGSYYVRTISDRWRFGFATFTLVGAALDYEDGWAGRYQCQEVSILTVTFNPTLACKLSDELSVAAGVGAMYGELELEAAIPLGPLPDGKAEIDGDDWAYGWNLGLLYEMTEYTRFGAIYWSNMDLEFSGDAKISPIGAAAAIDTDLPMAQFIRGGFYHDLNDKWAVLGTVSWEEWSRLDNVNISSSRGTTPIPKNWDDTWQYALGFHYRPNNKWLLQTGISYDTSPTSPGDRTADMPIDQQIRYAVGGQYEWSETFSIGGSFEYVDLGSAKINRPALIGEYDRNAIFALGVNANWKF